MDPINIAILVAVILFLAYKLMGARRSPAQLAAIASALDQGAKLVDVRSPGEFASGHLPGALNLPLGELARRTAELGPKDQPVVVVCASGARSKAAAGILRQEGFQQVLDLGTQGNGQKLPRKG